jgi:hypothetical protein
MIQVETFEVEEVTGEARPEVEAEAMALAEKLGLEGQIGLVVRAESGDSTRIPYPEMTKADAAVYEAVFPVKTEVSKYSAGILPLRVMQVVAYCRERELYGKIEVWHKRVRDPDPILVGVNSDKRYLLARWGDALAPMKDLVAEATEKVRAEFLVKLERCKTACAAKIASIDSVVASYLAGEWQHIPETY